MENKIYGKHYPRFEVVRVSARLDKNGKTVYYQTLDPLWAKRISREIVENLRAEGRLCIA